MRTNKTVTDKKDIDYLINLNQSKLESLSFIMETFGEFNGKQRFNTYDIVTIPENSYGPEGHKNKNKFTTTVGRYVFNKCFIEPELFNLFGYINKSINKKTLKNINNKISYALLEDKITLDDMKKWLMRCQKFQPYSNILCAGYTMEMLNISKKIEPKKKALLKENKEAIEAGDEKVMAKIENELLDYSKELLKGDPSMDLYDSGAKGSFGNNFKNLFVCRGATKDPDPTKGYDIITSNYIDGISKEDYPKAAKSLAAGPYARAKKTALGGYWEKLFLRAFQHMILGPEGSDCGTNRTIEFFITEDNVDMVMYNYIVEGTRLVELTSDNMNKYINKLVKMRFYSLCEYKENGQVCNKCAGNMFYRAGYKNIGTATPQLSSKLKLISMKAFHDAQVKLHKIDVAKAFDN